MKATPDFSEDSYSLRRDIRNISRIFDFGRPAKSANETYWVDRYLIPYIVRIQRLYCGDNLTIPLYEDDFVYDGKKGGNLILKVGESPITLFSSHTDTVDSRGIDWYNGRRKGIVVDVADMKIRKKGYQSCVFRCR